MRKLKQIVSVMMILILLLVSGCSDTTKEMEQTTGWLVSDIVGNVTADTEIDYKDDFHLAVNKDWILGAKIPQTEVMVSPFTERMDEVKEQILMLLEKGEDNSHEAKLVRQLFRDLTDMDTRNALGMKPIMPYIEKILAINSIEELTDYYMNWKENPVSSPVNADWLDSSKIRIFLGASKLYISNAAEHSKMMEVEKRMEAAQEVATKKLLIRTGFTDQEAQEIYDNLYSLETDIASVSMSNAELNSSEVSETSYNPVTLAELKELSPTFPITQFLKEYIEAGADTFILTESEWLKNMNELYTEENLPRFKAKLLVDIVFNTAKKLDQECIDIMDEYESALAGSVVVTDITDDAYSNLDSYLGMAVGKMYVDAYVSPETKETVTQIVKDAIDVYRTRLENNNWLGEKTRQKAIAKLDTMIIRVAYPDDWSFYDYSDLSLASVAEGGTPLDNLIRIENWKREKDFEKAIKGVKGTTDHAEWLTSPQMVNAFYNPQDNSVNIPAGILGGIFYDPKASYEQQLGSIGVIIGHEITHAFDTIGSQFDENGNSSNWWTDEDQAAFQERTDKVAAFFDQFEVMPGIFVNGEMTIDETIADLGGFSCMLEIARGIEDFDYDTFFTAFARVWQQQTYPNNFETMVQTTPYAPNYLRTNATVQQFQEFYDTYKIKEGDGMYLAPEKRLSVW